MHYVVGLLLLIVVAGFAAGFFLAPIPLVILAIIAIAFTVTMYRGGVSDSGSGTSGGIGLVMLSAMGVLFLVALVAGALAGYGSCSAIVDIDWPSLGDSLRDFLLRQ